MKYALAPCVRAQHTHTHAHTVFHLGLLDAPGPWTEETFGRSAASVASRRWSSFFVRTRPIRVFDELIDKTCRFERTYVYICTCMLLGECVCTCTTTTKSGWNLRMISYGWRPHWVSAHGTRHVCEPYLFNYYFDCVSMSVLLCTHVYSFCCLLYTFSICVALAGCVWFGRGRGGKVFCVEVPRMPWRPAWHNYGVLMYRSQMIRLKYVCVCILPWVPRVYAYRICLTKVLFVSWQSGWRRV